MSKIRVFRLNDYEWYAGESLEACVECMAGLIGDDYDELSDLDEAYAPYVLSEEDMATLEFYDESGPEPVIRTFAEQLDLLVRAGYPFPCMFAMTEF